MTLATLARHKKRLREIGVDPRGFTLLEVLIATLILLVALLGVAALVVGVIRANDRARALTVATTLAGNAMEREAALIAVAGEAPLSVDTRTETGPIEDGPAGDVPAGFVRKTTWWPDSPGAGMVTVSVRVEWAGGGRALTYSTILKKRVKKPVDD